MTVDQNISSRIDLMRILLIGGIVFVHVPYNPQVSPFLADHGLFDWLRVFLGESLFRIGVPCLSAISGYLLYRSGGRGYPALLASKSRSVLLPFLLWNLGFLAVVFLAQSMGIGFGYLPDVRQAGSSDLFDQALAVNDYPVNLPLYFLRDLLICILLSPILAFMVRRAPALTLGVLFGIAIFPSLDLGIVLKTSILFSFTLGIFLAVRQIDLKCLDRYALPICVAFLLVSAALATALYQSGPEFPAVLEALRAIIALFGALGAWMFSALLIDSRLGHRLSRTGSLSFWIFCGHYPVLILLWMCWNRIGNESSYPFFYVAAILLTFSVLILSHRLVRDRLPAIYGILTGSRGRKAGLTGSHPARRAGPPLSTRFPAAEKQR